MDLPEEFVRPDYQGGTVANIPATVAALLDAPFRGLGPVYPELWEPLAGDTRRVVLLLLDSLGWHLCRRETEKLYWLEQAAAVSGQLTSVFPSTTVAALSSLWTGLAPAQHGLVGLRLLFPEQAVLGQMLSLSPNFASYPGALIEAGIDPDRFLTGPGLGEQLAASGVSAYSLKGHNIIHSALSRMHDRGVTRQLGYVSSTDLFLQLRELLEATTGQRGYIYAYWPTIDTLMHVYGPDHPAAAAELHLILYQLKHALLEDLSPEARQGTVLLITADHGQVLTAPELAVGVPTHPELASMLLMRAAGEPRTAYLYARQGAKADLLAYLQGELGDRLAALDAEEALESGLLGPAPHAAQTSERLGDVIAVMRRGHIWLHQTELEKAGGMVGRHGGLTADEMQVPFWGLRLDA
jgi:hypothetical protein